MKTESSWRQPTKVCDGQVKEFSPGAHGDSVSISSVQNAASCGGKLARVSREPFYCPSSSDSIWSEASTMLVNVSHTD